MIIVNNIGGSFGDFDDRSYLGGVYPAGEYGSWQTQAHIHPSLPLPVLVVEDVYDTYADTPATQGELLTDGLAVAGTWQNPPPLVMDLMVGSRIDFSLQWEGPLADGAFARELDAGTAATLLSAEDAETYKDDPRFDNGWLIDNRDGDPEWPRTDPLRRFFQYGSGTVTAAGEKPPLLRTAEGSEEWLRNSHPDHPLSEPDIAGLRVASYQCSLTASARISEGDAKIKTREVFIAQPFGDDGPGDITEVVLREETNGIKHSDATIRTSLPVYVTSARVWLVGIGVRIVQSRWHSYDVFLPSLEDRSATTSDPADNANPDLYPDKPWWKAMIAVHSEEHALQVQAIEKNEAYRRTFDHRMGVDRWTAFRLSERPEKTEFNGMATAVEVTTASRYPIFQPKL